MRGWGVDVPRDGAGSIGYVIAAYNEFTAVGDGAHKVWLLGIEFAYRDRCATGRTCQLSKQFDTAACYLIRAEPETPRYEMRCLGGPDLTPTGPDNAPVQRGEAFVATRTILPSPFDDDRIYFGGYDANSVRSLGTACVATAARTSAAT